VPRGAVELLEVAELARGRARIPERRVAGRAGNQEGQHVQPRGGEQADSQGQGEFGQPAARVDEVVEAEHLVEDVVVQAAEEPPEHAHHGDREEVADVVPDRDVTHVKQNQPALPEHAAPPVPAHLDEAAEDDHDRRRAEEGAPEQGAAPPRGHLLQREQHARRGAARDEVPPVAVVV
jgi:hypothetical protein